jgi:hypothetical protein
MRMSKLMLKTLRSTVGSGTRKSQPLPAGLVTCWPPAFMHSPRLVGECRKVEGIIRDEMDGIGAQEVRP